jgi:hypothetical protein
MGLEIVSGESPDPYWEIVSWENALPVEVNLFRHTYNTLRPPRPSTKAHHARLTSPSNTRLGCGLWRTRYLTGRS